MNNSNLTPTKHPIKTFVESSVDCITITKFQQLIKENPSEIIFANSSISAYKNIYILTQLFGNAYVLKLDNINTFKYIYKQLGWNDPYTLERYNKVFNYDEQKIVQDGHTYNVITEDDVLDYYFDSYFYIDIVDAKTRIKVFNIYINKTKAEVIILPEKFAIDRFTEFKYKDNSSYSIDQLPENIKNYITSQLTLLTLKDDKYAR